MTAYAALGIDGAWRLTMEPHPDERGWFARYFCADTFAELGGPMSFVQFNHSMTRNAGSIRGLHLQLGRPPESKLVKCVRGAVLDVLVDVRAGSPTFLQHVTLELSAGGDAVVIPPGVAHGFQTLVEDTELIYHHTAPYRPGDERGFRYDDPRIGVAWPLPPADVSDKDRQWAWLDDGFEGFTVA
jgi:dTDP-4-dehydrorhamnose 3,5-epimerase